MVLWSDIVRPFVCCIEACGLTLTVWYYFNDIFPPLHNGRSPLDPPTWWIRLFDGVPAPTEETHEDDAVADHGNDEQNPNNAVPVQ